MRETTAPHFDPKIARRGRPPDQQPPVLSAVLSALAHQAPVGRMSSDRLDSLTLAEALDLLRERDVTIRQLQSATASSGLATPDFAEALEASRRELADERTAANELRAALAEAIAEAERHRAAAAAARSAADEAVLALRAAGDVVGSGGMSSRETAELVGMELSKAKLEVVSLTEQLAAVESQLRSARVAQHIEARDTVGAASLCRQSVKEIVSLHQALDAIVADMEDATGADGAAAGADDAGAG